MPTTQTTRIDTENLFNWDTIVETRDEDGTLTDREVFFDNGVQRFEEYADGFRSFITQTDNIDQFGTPPADGGARPWEEIRTEYDQTGLIAFRETLFDNGVQRFEEFSEGTRTTVTQVDNIDQFGQPPADGGAKAWQEIRTEYDDNGDISARETVFDNGVERFEEFEDGARTVTTQVDNVDQFGHPPADGGAKAWQEIRTEYDENGDINARETIFDNGVQKFEEFTDGLRTTVTQVDNIDQFGQPPADGGAKAWQEIRTEYNTAGVITSRETLLDNGVQKFEEFENGVRSSTLQTDNFDGAGQPPADGGAKAWTQVRTVYDGSGDVDFRDTVFDNGVIRFEEIDDGVRTLLLEEDPLDAKTWDKKMSIYGPDGSLFLRALELDNTDHFVFIHNGDEDAQVKIEQDGDDSDIWAVRITEYGDNGPEVATYDSFDDVPDQYSNFLIVEMEIM